MKLAAGAGALAVAAAVSGCAGIRRPSASADGGGGAGGGSTSTVVDAAADVAADHAGSADRLATPDITITTSDATTGGMEDAACATQTATAQTLPLDLFMMVDSSGSMTEKTAAGTTKWAAVQSAMSAFFNDPMSAGISVGLQYFPQIQPNLPTTCSSNGNCGSSGPCDLYRTCFGIATTQIVLCNSNVGSPGTELEFAL